jgi:prephenate dehydrogenase
MPSSSETPPFATIAIAGLGLIGGSIALAVRERWPQCRIVGVDRPSAQSHALSSGALDRAAAGQHDLGGADLIVLAAPVSQNVAMLPEAARAGGEAVITDVGGTKRDIMAAAAQLPRPAMFVGGHPIGGGERGGFGFARPDLFVGRPWIFTPVEATAVDPITRLSTFVQRLGARPTLLDPERHDRLMAFLSHLPQLTSSALMQVAGAGASSDGLRLAGRGLIDTTRLASSPADVWRDVCAANADVIREALDALIARLGAIRDGLARGEVIDAVFEDAARWRAELMKERS